MKRSKTAYLYCTVKKKFKVNFRKEVNHMEAMDIINEFLNNDNKDVDYMIEEDQEIKSLDSVVLAIDSE